MLQLNQKTEKMSIQDMCREAEEDESGTPPRSEVRYLWRTYRGSLGWKFLSLWENIFLTQGRYGIEVHSHCARKDILESQVEKRSKRQ